MIGKREFLVGLIVVLGLFAQACAETIPFDYFYGRLIGKHQITVNYGDSQNGYSVYALSYSVGLADRALLEFPHIVIWTPKRDENKTDWTNPTISGACRLSGSTRYNLEILDYRSDDLVQNNPGGVFTRDSDEISLLHSVTYLQGAGVEYQAENSLLYYLEGLFPGKGQTLLSGTSQLRFTKSRNYSYFLPNKEHHQWSEHRSRYYRLAGKFEHGVRSDLSVGVNFDLGYTSASAQDSSDEYPPEYFERRSLRFSRNGQHNTSLRLTPSVKWRLSPRLWIGADVNYSHDWRSSDGFSASRDYGMDTERISAALQDSRQELISIGTNVTWISKKQEVPITRLLDDFQGYYGRELESRTVVLRSDFSYRRTNQYEYNWKSQAARSTQRRLSPAGQRLQHLSSAEYFFSRQISVNGRFQLSRTVAPNLRPSQDGFSHSQTYNFALSLSYRNFSWSADQRRDISWAGISDIDYLLGAMMRPGDSRLTFTIQPPSNTEIRYSSNGNLWSFFGGEFGDSWHFAADGLTSFARNLDLDVSLEYLTTGDNGHSAYRQFTISPRVRFQPLSWLRVSGYLTEIYAASDDNGEIIDKIAAATSNTSRYWTAKIGVDCAF